MTSLQFQFPFNFSFVYCENRFEVTVQGCMGGGHNGNINFQTVKALYSTIKDRLPSA